MEYMPESAALTSRTFSISWSGFQSCKPLRQGVWYDNPTWKAVFTRTC